MKTADLYVSKSIIDDALRIANLRQIITVWAKTIPHHNMQEMGEQMHIDFAYHKPVYVHSLVSLIENRDFKRQKVPYNGQGKTGIPDLNQPFALKLSAKEPDYQEVKHSYSFFGEVSYCQGCSGVGSNTCSSCKGAGENDCYSCGTRGRTECWNCHGRGYVDCTSCDVFGQESKYCYSCSGSGRVQREGTCTACWGYSNNQNCYRCGGSGRASSNEECGSCWGRGSSRGSCSRCGGSKSISCSTCGTSGKITCNSCGGDGHVRCAVCAGSGRTQCSTCSGRGKLIDQAELSQVFSVERLEAVPDDCDFSKTFLKLAISKKDTFSDQMVFKLDLPVLPEVLDLNNAGLLSSYQSLRDRSAAQIRGNARLVKQQFEVWSVDAFQLKCQYRGNAFDLWIYGRDQKVYDGGSPIYGLREELIRSANEAFENRKFAESFLAIDKAFGMQVSPDQQDVKVLRLKMKYAAGRALKLGLVTGGLAGLSVLLLGRSFLVNFLLNEAGAADLWSGAVAVTMILMVLFFSALWYGIPRIKGLLRVRKAIFRFGLGTAIGLLTNFGVFMVLTQMAVHGKANMIVPVGAWINHPPEVLRSNRHAAGTDEPKQEPGKESPENRQKGVRLLFKGVKTTIKEMHQEEIYDSLGLVLAPDGKHLANPKDSLLKGSVLRVKLYPLDISGNIDEDLFIWYGNGHPEKDLGTVFLFIKALGYGYETNLGFEAKLPRFIKTSNWSWPDLLITDKDGKNTVWRWDSDYYRYYRNVDRQAIDTLSPKGVPGISTRYERSIKVKRS